MPQINANINVATFQDIANQAKFFGSRDIVVEGQGKASSARLGNLVFSHGTAANKATMAAFKAALENEYGVFGTHAFDTVLGARDQLKKSLRACDVKAAISKLEGLKNVRFMNELDRQLNTNPKFRELPEDVRKAVIKAIQEEPFKGCDVASCKKPADMARQAARRIEKAIGEKVDWETAQPTALSGRKQLETEAKPNEPTGLRNLKVTFEKGDASVEDQVKLGKIGAGMLMNKSATAPVLLEKLKTNGVEPGFIYRNDWSLDDTRGMMADINSAASKAALDDLKKDPAFAEKCKGLSLQRQIMLAGRAHPAAMAAVSEWAIQEALSVPLADLEKGNHPFAALGKAIRAHFNGNEPDRIKGDVSNPKFKEIVEEIKKELFVEIRDAVMSIDEKSDFYAFSPIFRHFSERAIMKLDYNENDRLFTGGAASSGAFRRPERILATRGAISGPVYRFTSRQSADTISAGAVTEALANDLTRLAGVPSQELQIVRGKYSDGHPKIMLSAKFAVGYKDMENGMLKDGRAVPGTNADGTKGPDPEPLGKYKAFFLLTADRDGVGKRGQNKGFIGGKFFAIDPGHSLEGNGKYLAIADDFSFKDTYGKSLKPRFNNFSVFDDDTRFAKLKGLVDLRAIARSGAFEKLFADYKKAFDPQEPGITPDEKALREKITADIDVKKTEFDQQLARLMDIFDMQLRLFDDLAENGPEVQEKAVNALSHLEMLTSPTTWVSKKGKLALNHLEVRPETRVPWKARLDGENLVYFCDKPMDGRTEEMLRTLAESAGVKYGYDNLGRTRIEVPKDGAERFFAVFSEDNVQKLTHPEEYAARTAGGADPLKVAKDYTPPTFKKVSSPLPPLKAADLPDVLDVEVNGRVVKLPKIHYEKMATTASDVSRPRSVGELRATLGARIQRGTDIYKALICGDTKFFKATQQNIADFTLALHAAALAKGEFMHRGAFSVYDPDGHVARWLDTSPELYLRSSTHAKPYQKMWVDGHLNVPRGIDVGVGMGGMLNGMRTFHYFSLPDMNHLEDAGGSGPRRRLFFKCETYGIYYSTVYAHPVDMSNAFPKGQFHHRKVRVGNAVESIAHMCSLFTQGGRVNGEDGIRKETFTPAMKATMQAVEQTLRDLGYVRVADVVHASAVSSGGGYRLFFDSLQLELAKLTNEKGLAVLDALAPLLDQIAEAVGGASGEVDGRIGNEIMLDPKDFVA